MADLKQSNRHRGGGLLGARIGRKLPPLALRIFIVVIGLISVIQLIFF